MSSAAPSIPRQSPAARRQSPCVPPVFSSSRTPSSSIPRSIALTMSYTVKSATETAVRASISTPVRPGPPHRHAKASSQLRQLIRQYGRNELRVHVPLGQFARGERTGNRLHHPGGFAAGPRLAPQLLEQSVQHRREPTARLEWRL